MRKISTLTWALSLALPTYFAHAVEHRTVYTPQGVAAFELRFFDVGDGPFMGDPAEPDLSTWNLTTSQKNKITEAVRRWAEIIEPNQAAELPSIINVGTFNTVNAAASSLINGEEDDTLVTTQLQALLQGENLNDDLHFGSHGQMIIGRFDFDESNAAPSQILETKKMSLADTTFHELGHSLGITSLIDDENEEEDEDKITPYFQSALISFEQLLHDDNGNPAQTDQMILCHGCDNDYSPNAFDVRKDQGYLSGKHIDEVLAGGLRGIPVKMLNDYGSLDDNYMSHTELKNSMMSHQNYQNYTTFMEAELALMQDLGYQIDRRNFFGHSVYGNGLKIVNTNGFAKRNTEGTAYLPGEYNTATLGLGLHVYGSNNSITQQADLLAKGDGGAGIRVDGVANTLIIDPSTRIYADGLNGRGVLFAYGKDHNLIQQGDVQALGQEGIAVSFDFGYNQFGYDNDHRGSYIRTYEGQPVKMLDELNGALVKQFDLSGRVAGKKAAIYLSETGLVNQINVMQGAQIEGDIRSDYAQKDEIEQLRLTTLSFGKDTQGQNDAAFTMAYDGNIQGENIALVTQAGQTALNGQHHVFNVRVAPTATLTGSANYTLNETQAFLNEGTLAPGHNDFGRMIINGNYQQTAQGMMVADVNGAGQHATLAINGHAALDGYLSLYAKPDWYAQDWTLRSDDIVQSTSRTGDFAAIGAIIASPTLWLDTAPISAGVTQLFITRYDDAYSQYAQDANQYAVGNALYEVAGLANPDIQPLYRFLDFSAIDGSTIHTALDQLSPMAYSAMASSSLRRERQLTDVINARPTPVTGTDWQAFVAPFGEHSTQDRRGSLVASKYNNYGLVMGIEKNGLASNSALSAGLYGAISRQSVSLRDNLNGKGHSTALHVGGQLRFTPNPKAGIYAYSSAQLGWEDSKFNRQLHLPGYATNSYTSDWTAWSGTVAAGGGYRWALSESVSAGPVTQLSYTTLGRPSVTESGEVTALNIHSQRLHALRSSLGLRAQLEHQTINNHLLKAEMQATWDRELLNKNLVQEAHFAGYPSATFTTRNQVTGKNALGLRAGLSYEVNNSVAIAAGLSTSLFQSGYKSVAGNVSAQWRF